MSLGSAVRRFTVAICGSLFPTKRIEDFVKVAERFPVRFIWLGSTNADSQEDSRNTASTLIMSASQVTSKGAVFQGAMSGANAFFFPSYEETKAIVVLDSHQHVVLRDILLMRVGLMTTLPHLGITWTNL